MLKAVIFDVGGILLGGTDLLETSWREISISMHTRTSIDSWELNSSGRLLLAGMGLYSKKVIEILDSAIEVVNQEHNICLASVNAGEKRT